MFASKMKQAFTTLFTLLTLWSVVTGITKFSILDEDTPCKLLDLGFEHRVCVCNSEYCDTIITPKPVQEPEYLVYTSSRAGLRFDKKILISVNASVGSIYKLDLSSTRQTIVGFGGAFTDAAGINIVTLPAEAQSKLISSYYGPDGIEYTIGRVPMASCDFSTHPYSYDDVVGDMNLTKFALAPEDVKYKIPFIKKALSISPSPIRMFGSPWSSPAWMKTNKNMTGKGGLIGNPGGPYYKTWANYFVKFLQAYKAQGISFWGLTTQNEPTNGLRDNFPFQALAFTPELQRDFIKLDLGPTLHEAGYGNLTLMMLDDQRLFLAKFAEMVLGDPEAAKYVSSIALHWYMDSIVPADIIDKVHASFPNTPIFATEACEGSMPWQAKVDLGSWDRGASYASDILTDLNHWVTGWTDWNIALSPTGGPNWVSNFVDSPIIVDPSKNEFYKQPMYYVLGHFSKFVRPGSIWINTTSTQPIEDVEIASFVRPDKSVAVVIHNKSEKQAEISVTDGKAGYKTVTSPPFSIQTVLFWL